MHYIIDGYNLMFSMLSVEETLQSDRDEIISDLNEKIQFLNLDTTIVFDGHFRYGLGSRSHKTTLEIRFTDHEESADDSIIHELERTANPRNQTVVTNDKQLAWRARQRCAKTLSINKFITWLNTQFHKKGSSAKKVLPPPPPAPPSHEFTVTDDAFEFYLQEFEKRFKEMIKSTPPRKENPLSELKRWEKIFEERLKQNDE